MARRFLDDIQRKGIRVCERGVLRIDREFRWPHYRPEERSMIGQASVQSEVHEVRNRPPCIVLRPACESSRSPPGGFALPSMADTHVEAVGDPTHVSYPGHGPTFHALVSSRFSLYVCLAIVALFGMVELARVRQEPSLEVIDRYASPYPFDKIAIPSFAESLRCKEDGGVILSSTF